MKSDSQYIKNLIRDFLNCDIKELVRDARNRKVYRFANCRNQGYYIKVLKKNLISCIKIKIEENRHRYLMQKGAQLPQLIGSSGFIDKDGTEKIALITREITGIPLTELTVYKDRFKFGEILDSLLNFLVDNYKNGVMHSDLHFGNILLIKDSNNFVFVDAKKIKYKKCYTVKEVITNFCLLYLSLHNICFFNNELWDNLVGEFFKKYGIAGVYRDYAEIVRVKLFKNWIKRRTKRCFRDNLSFTVFKNKHISGVYQKKYSSFFTENDVFKYLDSVFSDDKTKFIKNSNTTAVVKLNFLGEELIIKKFKIKRKFDPVKNIFRKSRGYRCWKWSWMLNLYKIQVPEPVFFLEKRVFGMLGENYFATKYCSQAETVSDYLNQCKEFDKTVFLRDFSKFVSQLLNINLCHNDFQLKNILVKEESGKFYFYLIDLEAVDDRSISYDEKLFFYISYLKKSFLRLDDPQVFSRKKIVSFIKTLSYKTKTRDIVSVCKNGQ